MPMKIYLYAALILLLACSSDDVEINNPHGDNDLNNADIRILFLGNSLTYGNDLPELVRELAYMDGVNVGYTMIAKGNYSLEDHWNDEEAQVAIQNNDYDFVIAQQGPSALPESQINLLEFATRYAEFCIESETKFGLYMVWPSQTRSFDLDNVIYSYTQAAEKTSSLLCPAGLAWKYAWEKDSDLGLYSSDFFHPSVMGSVLAGMVIYGSVNNKSSFEFINYQNASWKNDVSEQELVILKESAEKALKN